MLFRSGAGDVRHDAVEHPASLQIGIEAPIDEIADAAAGLRTAVGIGLFGPGQRVGGRAVVFQKTREVPHRHVTETHLARQATIRVEHRIVRADGSVRYLAAIGKPLPADDGTLHYVGTVTDITGRREAEDALRSAQADLARVARATTVGQLTASIAHEINQPLMSIVSNAGASLRWLARATPDIDNAREGLEAIRSEGQRAGDMIRSLQALTRNAAPVLARVDLHVADRKSTRRTPVTATSRMPSSA